LARQDLQCLGDVLPSFDSFFGRNRGSSPARGSRRVRVADGLHNLNAVITDVTPGLTEDVVGHFAKSLVGAGHRITLDHLCVVADAFVADSKKAAIAEYSPSYLHFTQTLWHHRTGAGFRPHQRE
jgi:hypothetical protein